MSIDLLKDFQNCSSELEAWYYAFIIFLLGVLFTIDIFALYIHFKTSKK